MISLSYMDSVQMCRLVEFWHSGNSCVILIFVQLSFSILFKIDITHHEMRYKMLILLLIFKRSEAGVTLNLSQRTIHMVRL